MSTRKVYGRPPVLEATFTINFSAGAEDWELATPLAIYSKLSDIYTARPSQNFSTHLGVDEGDGGPSITVRAGEPQLELRDKAGTRVASFGPESISVTAKAPYEGWESLRSRLRSAIEVYQQLVNTEPVARLTASYSNEFGFDGMSVALNKYFVNPPEAPDVPGLELDGFLATTDTFRAADGVSVVHAYQSSLLDGDRPAVRLNIEVSKQWGPDDGTNLDLVDEAEKLHSLERDVFESLITDEARRLFDDD